MKIEDIKRAPIELLFCSSPLAFSKLIMWSTSEPVSHVAIDMPNEREIIHSDLVGVHSVPRMDFLNAHKVSATFKIWLGESDANQVATRMQDVVDNLEGGMYDFGALTYFAIRLTATKFLGVPFPKRNLWGDSDAYLCTEAAGLLVRVIAEVTGKKLIPDSVDLGITAPWALYELLKAGAGGKNEMEI